MTSKATVWLDVLVKISRLKATLVDNGDTEAWIPNSLILDAEDDIEDGVETRIEIAEWLAIEKGLV